MTFDSRGALVRRAMVTVGAIATVSAAAGVAHLAQVSTAASVPVDVAPVAMTSVQGQIDQQVARVAALGPDAGALDMQVRTLFDAVASNSVAADAQTMEAARVAKDLAAAKARLGTLQGQLTAAGNRLAALNAVGARSAASSASTQGKGAVSATTGASGAAGGGGTDD
jgi:hypothetical protein